MPKLSISIIGFLILASGALIIFKFFNFEIPKPFNFETFKLFGGGSDDSEMTPNPKVSPDLPQTYTHPNLGFSFRYPDGFKVSSTTNNNGEMVLVQKSHLETGFPSNESFQIFISEFDEPGPITEERIRRDLPEMVVENPQIVIIGQKSKIPNPKSETNSKSEIPNSKPDQVTALIFFSQDKFFGRTREVWFVWPESPQPNGNYLYQISSPAEFDAELSKIMATFTFRN